MKILLVICVALIGAITFGAIAYYLVFGRIVRANISSQNDIFTFDRVLALSGLVVTVILTIIGLYVAYKSLVIAKITYDQSQESGPKTEAILTQSRNALELSVEILRKQQISTDSSRIALNIVSKTALKQQKLLEQSLKIFGSQLDIAVRERQIKNSADRNRLRNTISKIFDLFPPKGFDTFNEHTRQKKIEWVKSVLVLFELETNNSVLLQDEEASQHWQETINRLMFQMRIQTNDAVEHTVIVTSESENRNIEDIEKVLNDDFQHCVSETNKATLYALKKVVEQKDKLAESIYSSR